MAGSLRSWPEPVKKGKKVDAPAKSPRGTADDGFCPAACMAYRPTAAASGTVPASAISTREERTLNARSTALLHQLPVSREGLLASRNRWAFAGVPWVRQQPGTPFSIAWMHSATSFLQRQPDHRWCVYGRHGTGIPATPWNTSIMSCDGCGTSMQADSAYCIQ